MAGQPTLTVPLTTQEGVPGKPIKLGGTHFGTDKDKVTVRFGFLAVTPKDAPSDTNITVIVPDTLPTGKVTVVVSVAGVDSNSGEFAVICDPVAPCISSISPNTAVPGDQVTISGKNFGTTAGTITLGSTPMTVIPPWTDSQIVATVPAAPAGPTFGVVTAADKSKWSPHSPFTLVTNIDFDLSPPTIQAANGKLPATVNFGLFEKNCDNSSGVDLSQGGGAPYSVKIMGAGIRPSAQPTVGKCAISSQLTVDPSTTAGPYDVILVNKDNKPLGKGTFNVMDSSAGPIPPGLAPQVDVMWEVMSQDNCSDVFGKRVSQTEYCIQVQIGNNSGYPLQIAGMGFSRKIESLPGQPKLTTANSSYVSTRAVLLEQNVTNGRNIAYNVLQAAGVLMAATTPFFGTGNRYNPKTGAATNFNNARTNWATIGNIVAGPALSAFNIIAPNPILNQLNNLDDQSFRDSKLIANNSQIKTVIFVEKRALTDHLRDFKLQYAQSLFVKEILSKGVLDNTITNSTNPSHTDFSKEFPWFVITKKGDFDPTLVKIALGDLVIVGDLIAYLNRVQIQSNALPSSTPSPLDVKPSALSFVADANGVTDGGARSVTITNVGTSDATGVSVQLTGPNASNFVLKSDCPASLASGASCKPSASYSPTPVAGGGATRTANLQISSNSTVTPVTVQVTGAASNTVVVSSTSLTFDASTKSAPLTITNFEGNGLQLSKLNDNIKGTDASLFAVDDKCDSLVQNSGSCKATITFKPGDATGQHKATLTLTGTVSGGVSVTKDISLIGTN